MLNMKFPFFLQACITLKKPEDDNKTNFTETELFDTLNAIYTFCFLDIEADQVLRTEKKIKAQIKQILDHIEANVGGSIVKRVRPTVSLMRHLIVDLAHMGSCL